MKKIVGIWGSCLLLLSGCSAIQNMDVLNPAGSQAEEQYSLIKLSIYIMLIVMVTVVVLFIRFVYKYRARPGFTPEKHQENRNKKLELTWTILPFVLLLILAVPMVKSVFGEEKQDNTGAMKVKVTASKYWWKFEYPGEGIVTSQELHLPKGKRVVIELHSKDVIHSFWVPQLGGKQDLIPGRTNKMALTPEKVGTYQGKCGEFCGAGHSFMRFLVKVDSQRDYQEWVDKMKKENTSTKLSAQESEGQKVFAANCLSCHATSSAVSANQGKEGPNLADFGDRKRVAGFLPNTEKNVLKWLKNPKKVKPGTEMPKAKGLSNEDYAALSAYLKTLKK
ncbi:cytochrome c oxidase subunit II [Fictibacillus enclensis]|uniref:cytochrome c oxidase subunit II n=1 Tax=Fictibacillus enclensis TaxID=1017270 RepID=UPI0024C0AFB4|nr:cytochrome c oxidase subunit II [Fictibacillus enclensis]WHY72110.1 cytochrome c oxidase subunit II [Fictibacillus enclensis]